MKRAALASALLAAALLLSGCRQGRDNYRDIERLELMQTLGIDSDGEMITVSAATGKRGDSTVIVLKNSARTVAQALDGMQTFTEKDVYFSHIGACLIGQKAAENNIYCILDFIEREVSVRYDTDIFLVKNASAEDAVTLDTGETTCVTDLLSALKKSMDLLGDAHVGTLGETAQALLERDCALIAAVEISENGVAAGGNALGFAPAGYALIKGGALAAFADREQAHGFMLLTGQLHSDTVEVSLNGETAALSVVGAGVSYEPRRENGRIVGVAVKIKLRSSIDELHGKADVYSEEELEELAKGLEEITKKRVEGAMELCRAAGADFIGLGGRLERKDPAGFADLKENWNEVFSVIPLEYTYDVSIERTYNIASPLESGQGGPNGKG